MAGNIGAVLRQPAVVRDPDERGIVAVEITSRTEVEIFKRNDDRVTRERRPLQLFAIVEDREALRGFKAAHQVTELKGAFRFRHLVTLASTEALEALKRHLKNVTGKTSGSPEAPYLLLSDPVEQYLMLTGMTHFIGMEFASCAASSSTSRLTLARDSNMPRRRARAIASSRLRSQTTPVSSR